MTIQSAFGHDVHMLESLFHVTEILLSHVIIHIVESTISPDSMQAESRYYRIKNIGKPDIQNYDLTRFNIIITGKAKLHLQSLILWCAGMTETDPW